MECERCGAAGAEKRKVLDPWGRLWEIVIECQECWEREPPEPDLMAVSAQERYELAWDEKRRRER